MGIFKQMLVSGYLQTKDNNESIENQLENEDLTEEFNKRVDKIEKENLAKTLLLLMQLEIKNELETSGLLLTEKEAKNRSVKSYYNLIRKGIIDEFNNLKPAALECIKEELAK